MRVNRQLILKERGCSQGLGRSNAANDMIGKWSSAICLDAMKTKEQNVRLGEHVLHDGQKSQCSLVHLARNLLAHTMIVSTIEVQDMTDLLITYLEIAVMILHLPVHDRTALHDRIS